MAGAPPIGGPQTISPAERFSAGQAAEGAAPPLTIVVWLCRSCLRFLLFFQVLG
jgi:hypothetical protein